MTWWLSGRRARGALASGHQPRWRRLRSALRKLGRPLAARPYERVDAYTDEHGRQVPETWIRVDKRYAGRLRAYEADYRLYTGRPPDDPVGDMKNGWMAVLVEEVARYANHAVAKETGIARACRTTVDTRPAGHQVTGCLVDLLNHIRAEAGCELADVFGWVSFLASSPDEKVVNLARAHLRLATDDAAAAAGWAPDLLRAAALGYHTDHVQVAFAAGLSSARIADQMQGWGDGWWDDGVRDERLRLIDMWRQQAAQRGFRYP
jgi:hypothetical protein